MVYFSTYPSESVLLSSVLGRFHFKTLIFNFPMFSICMYLGYPLFQKNLYESTLSSGGHLLPAYITLTLKMVVHVTSALLCHIYSPVCSFPKTSLVYLLSTSAHQRSRENSHGMVDASFTQVGTGAGVGWAYNELQALQEVATRWNKPNPEFRVISYLSLKHNAQEIGAQTNQSAEWLKKL